MSTTITRAEDTPLVRQIEKLPLADLQSYCLKVISDRMAIAADLDACVKKLTSIWEAEGSEGHGAAAKLTLRVIHARVDCPFCSGVGDLACGSPDCHGGSHFDGSDCLTCEGSGSIPCDECDGKGSV